MKKILHIISSPRGEASMSIKLGNAIVEKIKATYPGSTVNTKDLAKTPFPHLEEAHLTSFFTPAEQRTPESLEAIKHSDQAIQEIQDADVIVIGAPLYNFSIPSTLKAWIDHITRAGVTFAYDENGPKGLIKNKKLYIAIPSGGIYSEGPMKSADFAEPYLRFMLGFLGMTDISVYRIEGLKVPGIQDTAVEKGIDSIVID
ncbi:FMN-dependent NADH-azoreductase [Mucilaginibacter sp. UYP25]|uniref:FMN-dependent NADH-azoreductase n=1 Tax=unclassified Mucilaginibacter TaxID=2617802 RepID=UPI003394C164